MNKVNTIIIKFYFNTIMQTLYKVQEQKPVHYIPFVMAIIMAARIFSVDLVLQNSHKTGTDRTCSLFTQFIL